MQLVLHRLLSLMAVESLASLSGVHTAAWKQLTELPLCVLCLCHVNQKFFTGFEILIAE